MLLAATLITTAVTAAEEEYTFKAKGEFAKELKELMDKYAKEGKIEIEESSTSERNLERNKSTSIIDKFLNNEETSGDIAYGKELYDKTCFKCHGEKAERSSYGNARDLNTLSKETLIEQLEGYARYSGYGGNTGFIMHQQVIGLGTEKIISIASYIYSLNPNAVKMETSKNKKGNNSSPTQGSYLK